MTKEYEKEQERAVVEQIAALSDLEVENEKLESLTKEMGRMLEVLQKLSGPEEAEAAESGPEPAKGAAAPDIPVEWEECSDVLSAGPEVFDDRFVVPVSLFLTNDTEKEDG